MRRLLVLGLLYYALLLACKTRARTCSTNQMQDQNRWQLGRTRFPARGGKKRVNSLTSHGTGRTTGNNDFLHFHATFVFFGLFRLYMYSLTILLFFLSDGRRLHLHSYHCKCFSIIFSILLDGDTSLSKSKLNRHSFVCFIFQLKALQERYPRKCFWNYS